MPDALDARKAARERLLRKAKQAIEDALADLGEQERELLETDRSYTTGDRVMLGNHWGKRGATRKRLAEVEFLLNEGDWRATLQAAQADYGRGLAAHYKDHWILGQFVVLRSVLDSAARTGQEARHSSPPNEWEEACRAVRLGLRSGDPYEKMWAWSSFVDLHMVALRENWPSEDLTSKPVREDLEEMVSVVGGADLCPAVWPTFRQFWRWRDWWRDPAWAAEAQEGYAFLYEIVKPRLPEGIIDKTE